VRRRGGDKQNKSNDEQEIEECGNEVKEIMNRRRMRS
jgi:hypothetical protein